jgi:RNA polymerase sigma-70 factor (ECF subfamily)
VRKQVPRFDVGTEELREIASEFMATISRGDLASPVGLLDPDAVLRTDGGGVVPAARWPVRGADKVARLLLGLSARYAGVRVRLVPVNGRPGFVLHDLAGWLLGVCAVAVADHRVGGIDLVLNPEKLRHVSVGALDGPEWTMPSTGS